MAKLLKEQIIPLILTIATFFALSFFLFWFIQILNLFPNTKIQTTLHIQDIFIGLFIYLKTSIDFALFIGNVMHTNPGVKNRISIEIGTAIGNALGTILVLLIWNFFREVPLLLAFMITVSSLVLLRMAQESLEEFLAKHHNDQLLKPVLIFSTSLSKINRIFAPFVNFILPHIKKTNKQTKGFLALLLLACTIPFILGLDDFAGYIPLFSIVNVFGFCVGIFLGHMILNMGLFMIPSATTRLIKTPIVLLIGGSAFILIALWGFLEASGIVVNLLLHLHF